MRSANSLLFAAVHVLLSSLAYPASAADEARALVRSVTTSALGEACGVYIHTVNLDRVQEIGLPLWLPADAPLGDIHLGAQGRVAATAVFNAGTAASRQQHLATFGALTVPPLTRGWFETPGTVPEYPAGFLSSEAQDWIVTFRATTLPGGAAERGTIAMRPIGIDGAATGPTTRQLVPGVPVAGITFEDHSSVAVLAWDRESAHWGVHVSDPIGRTGLRSSEPLAAPARMDGDTTSSALGIVGEGEYFLALIADSVSGQIEKESALIGISTDTLAVSRDALRIRGVPDSPFGAIVAAQGNAAWIVTRDSASAFGFASYVELGEDGPALKDDPSYTRVDSAPIVAPAPHSNAAAIAAGNRLEIREPGAGVQQRREFAASIRSLVWHGRTILVGEGGRFHRLDAASLSDGSALQFQTGRVDAIVTLPSGAWNAEDSDGDGLLDGVDPDVRVPTPVLIVDPQIHLRAAAAGYEVRILHIDSVPRARGRWSIQFDKTSAPWLHDGGMVGAIPGGPHLRLDPGALPETADVDTTIEVSVVDSNNRHYAGSPARVRVHAVQSLAPPRRIAWALGGSGDRERVPPIANTLSGAPFHFTHEYALSGTSLDPQKIAIVVLDESAAAQSIVTRRSVEEFVRNGGSLLFVRAPAAQAIARTTETWLRPFGVTLSAGEVTVQGAVAASAHPLARFWQPAWKALAGRGFSVDASASDVLAAGETHVFAATGHYGLGRVAVFASPSPLFDRGRESRRLAVELFAWLARAACADDPGQRDLDGDALPDWMEDRNRDTVHDPGETDWTDPDTDGDGIPDGAEDFNLNGVLDAAETSPLNYDTDGDGIWDGADATPIPPFAAPLIATVYPDSGPAHGGRTITIQGRNLHTNQRVWFGDRLASDVRAIDETAMSVVVPPLPLQSQQRAVDLRIEDTDTGLEHAAAGAFTYTEPALVRLTLRAVPESAGPNLGVLALRVTSSTKVAIGRVVLSMDTTPPNAVTWGVLEPGVAAAAQGRSVTRSAAPDGALSIAIGASRHAQGTGELVTIPWAFTGVPGEPVRIELRNARVTADNGYPLQVDATASVVLP